MKNKDQKYKEAVERNIRHVKRNAGAALKATSSDEKQLSVLKMRLGIRETDTTHDSDLNAALNAVRAAWPE